MDPELRISMFMNTPVGPPLSMKLREDDVIAEFSDAGYRLIRSHDFLPYQYFLEFGLADQ